MTDSTLAPVVLFVYKRPKHTRATLTALAKNHLAQQSDLFVYCDGPRNPQDAADVSATRNIVCQATGFKSVTLIERDRNHGLANSVIAGVTHILERFEHAIILEDDLLTSPYFLTFMNQAMAHYRDDPKAFSVTGHTFSSRVLTLPDDYPYDTYAGYRCSSWSWGTWRDRWNLIDWKMTYFPAFIEDQARKDAFNRGGEDLTPMLAMQYQGNRDSWAIRFAFAHYQNNCQCIYPTKTLVRNIGLDGSGTHTGLDKRFIHNSLGDNWIPEKFCPAGVIDPTIASNFHGIFRTHRQPLKTIALRKANRLLDIVRHAVKNLLDKIFLPMPDIAGGADILIVNTIPTSGGAARAAYRCFSGIRRAFPNARYLSLFNDNADNPFFGIRKKGVRGWVAAKMTTLDRLPLLLYPQRKRVIFSPGFWANPARIRIASFSPKLVHLHWVTSGMFDVEELARIDAPFVWTLHDQWAFTGGCHYADECGHFRQQCGRCPVLGSSDEDDLSHRLWLRKMAVYGLADITVVTPSRWMARMAKQSSLFAEKRIEVIPNGLDTDLFYPHDRLSARMSFGIHSPYPVLLFGAHVVSDHRKGGDLLAAALQRIDYHCVLLVFGEGEIDVKDNPYVQVLRAGSITDDEKLALLYSAADVYLCPSRVDNLPNTVAEAMACGVPCVAFDIGGLPDMIDHRVNGWLAEPYDVAEILVGISWVINHPEHAVLRNAARQKALDEYSLVVMTARYQALYDELMTRSLAE